MATFGDFISALDPSNRKRVGGFRSPLGGQSRIEIPLRGSEMDPRGVRAGYLPPASPVARPNPVQLPASNDSPSPLSPPPVAPPQAAAPAQPQAPALHPSIQAIRNIWSQPAQPFTPGPSGRQEVGGLFGQRPGEPVLPNPMARQGYGVTGNPGLGLAPANEQAYTAQMDWQNPTATNFGGTLPTMISAPNGGFREGFLSGPVRDMSQRPSFPAELYRSNERGSLVPASNGDVQMRTEAAKKFNARQERQKYLDARAKEMAERKALVTAKAQEKDKGRREKVRISRGQLAFEERLAAANPAAFQQRRALEARMNGEQIARQSAIEADERKTKVLADASKEEARIRANGVAAANGEPLPYPDIGPTGKAAERIPGAPPSTEEYANMSPQERQIYGRNLPQATRDRIEQELSRRSRLGRIFTGIDQPGQGTAVSDAMRNEGFLGLFGAGEYDPLNRVLASGRNVPNLVSPDFSRLQPDDLKDQPGDTPAQKRLKADLRKRVAASRR